MEAGGEEYYQETCHYVSMETVFVLHYQHHIQLFLIFYRKVLLHSRKQANYTSLNPYTIRSLWQFLKKKLTEMDKHSIKLIYPRLHICHFVCVASFYYLSDNIIVLICWILDVCIQTTHRSICKFELSLDQM